MRLRATSGFQHPASAVAPSGHRRDEEATAHTSCRNWGMAAVTKNNENSDTSSSERKVSFPLIMGILFVPYIFVWFLLKQGYSTTARAIGLSWAASVMAVMLFGAAGTNDSTGGSTRPAVEVDPDRAVKWHALTTAKAAVPKALRDPSSAKFGDVWGVSAGVACGSVNATNAFGAMAGQSRVFRRASGAHLTR